MCVVYAYIYVHMYIACVHMYVVYACMYVHVYIVYVCVCVVCISHCEFQSKLVC